MSTATKGQAALGADVGLDITYPPELPITARRDDLLATIAEHPVVIVAGETGSGKSTQLPKLCLELGRGRDGLIGHTQPRRIAARTVAERIADELHTKIGGLVGYAVRFTDRVGPNTRVKVMTDGILLAEVQRDPDLTRYDTIIIDEAHERSLNIDFLLGYLRRLVDRRDDLKVIITSATIDTERFSSHFGDAPVIEVSGRAYPVEIRWSPLDEPGDAEPSDRAGRRSIDQPEAICAAVEELYTEGPGDILVFCSGEREIRDAIDALGKRRLPDTELLPLYARLSADAQHRVFEAHKTRRVIVATNVAETSLTVPGVRYVVDTGTARISRYNRRTKVQRLPIEAISQASADQRAGRSGRLGPGIAIRLFAEDDFDARPRFTDPEIGRTSLASVILQMASLRLGDIESFPFVDPPDSRSIRDGITVLEELDAVDPERMGRHDWLTPIGRRMARLPLDPRLARMILEAERNGCLAEVIVIVAGLSVQDPRERPAGEEELADRQHALYLDPESDLLGWLALWDHVHDARKAASSANQFRKQIRREYLHYLRIREWQDIVSQIRHLTGDIGLERPPRSRPHGELSRGDRDAIHRSLLSGLLSQVGLAEREGREYRGARNARFAIGRGSALSGSRPRWVMAAEMIETNRLWARSAAGIRPEWLEEVGDHLVRRRFTEPWWDEERGSAMASERVSLFGLPIVESRTVHFGTIDRPAARALFIHHALVRGEWHTDHEFMRRNRTRVEEVEALEARVRRGDLLVSDDELFAFFDERIGEGVASGQDFNRWWKKARRRDPARLDLTTDDVVDDADVLDPEAYPEVWHYGDLELSVSYELEPSLPTDGVTIDVPVAVLGRLDPAVFEWNVPGLRLELVTELIRSLPKKLRKMFVPIPDTAALVLARLDPSAGAGLVDSLRRELSVLAGEPIGPGALDLDDLPNHLWPTFRVLGEGGEVLAGGGDLPALRERLTDEVRTSLSRGAHGLERHGLTDWSFGELPPVVETEGAGHRVKAYPALVDEGDSVAVRLFATAGEQAGQMWAGTRRLLALQVAAPRRQIRDRLGRDGKLALTASPYGSEADWADDVVIAALDRAMRLHAAPAWTPDDFARLRRAVRADLDTVAAVVATDAQALVIAYRDLQAVLGRATAQAAAVADVREQFDRLIYPGCVRGLGADRLADVTRYLRAASRRIERLGESPRRDTELTQRVRQLEADYDRLAGSVPASAELEELDWAIQELRVSLFAQAVGVKGNVSEKRIRAAMRQLLTG